MPVDKKEHALLIVDVSMKIKELQDELQKWTRIHQRLNLVNNPVDQFGERLPDSEIDKHFEKAKSDFAELQPASDSVKAKKNA